MKRRTGRPRTQPPRQQVHLRLPVPLYRRLVTRSRESGVPVNTLLERWIADALERKVV